MLLFRRGRVLSRNVCLFLFFFSPQRKIGYVFGSAFSLNKLHVAPVSFRMGTICLLDNGCNEEVNKSLASHVTKTNRILFCW